MDQVSRRNFLAVTASSALASSPPASAAGSRAAAHARIIGANDRIHIGVIGCGGMANGHMRALNRMKDTQNVEITAVSDVFAKRLEAAAQLTGGKPFKDYRRLLESKEIDYVLIATPEHWHAQMTLDAADAGKHIYCEKPMTYSIEEAKKVVAKVKATGVKMQVGVQGMSDESYEIAHQYVKEGTLGKVVLAQIDYSRNYKGDFWLYPEDPDARPGENLDWNAFLGPARKRPWDPERFFSWRRFWDYSGGIASDLFVHRITRIIKALGLTFPERVVATGGKFFYTQGKAEIPDTFNVLLDYPEGVTVQLISTMANDTAVDHLLRGNRATLQFTRTGFTITPQNLYASSMQPITYTKKGAEDISLHHINLQNAIRNNEPLKCDCMLGYYGVVAARMSVESYRRRKYLAWDRLKERVVYA
ncbi:MAG: Gfo/Idh/MocA family oxidoreductase [Bryobacteraceae bacterium]|nr:Gfo/Idh/MocA family oxidoreductase [Bryobacteraceae bacterium]MDW8377822.1 Gfo/Idh/MocA family oxidoreductase [Bryobacterales bacterium]